MSVLRSQLDTSSDTYRANRAAMEARLAALEALLDAARAGGGERYVKRHHARGKLLARERVELLLDPDAPFLELSPIAGAETEYLVGASLVTGVGVVEGTECVILANDPTALGGSINPYTLAKMLR
ncbi:MAG TPA: carboxyl transferase domain-containing protein, partial [Myxococcota bacterium]|nr:carboxyl transferase domain-containing protein [Myxococcota bacterium]